MERLEREYNLDLITTAPNVVYRITKTSGETIEVYTPLNYPDPAEILQCEEPFVRASILTPPEYVGNIIPTSLRFCFPSKTFSTLFTKSFILLPFLL